MTLSLKYFKALSIEYWSKLGVPKSKLLLSLPLFARTWNLYDAANPGRGALTVGPAEPGPITNRAGFLSYFEV